MSWKKTLVLGLVFGVSGLAYAAWRGHQERERERRKRLMDLSNVEPLRKCDGTDAGLGCDCLHGLTQGIVPCVDTWGVQRVGEA